MVNVILFYISRWIGIITAEAITELIISIQEHNLGGYMYSIAVIYTNIITYIASTHSK